MLATEPAAAAKVPVFEPEATLVEAGTVTALLFEESATVAPPPGAVPDKVTVQVEFAPDDTLEGMHCTPVIAGGSTVTAALAEVPLTLAVRVTDWLLGTEPAVAVNVATPELAATLAVAGMDRAPLLEERATLTPPAGAGADKVMVQVELAPDIRLAGTHRRVEMAGGAGVTVTVALPELPLSVAVTVAVWLLVTIPPLAMKLAVFAPAGTAIEVGTVNAPLFDDRATLAPPLGAIADNVTVQAELAPDAIVEGTHCTPEIIAAGGVTITDVFPELPLRVPVTVADWLAVTVPAAAANPPELDPAAMVTDPGTVNTLLLEDSATLAPPLGAMADSTTIQAVLAPDATVAGEHVRPDTVGSGGRTLIEPPVPETKIPVPLSSVPIEFATETGTTDPAGAVPIVIPTTAATPVPIVLAFMLEAWHVSDPLPAKQLTVLPAAVNTGPAVTLMPDRVPGV